MGRLRALNSFDTHQRRMIVGLMDDDTNLRFRRVGGYTMLGSGADLSDVIRTCRIDEIVITAQPRDESYTNLVALLRSAAPNCRSGTTRSAS